MRNKSKYNIPILLPLLIASPLTSHSQRTAMPSRSYYYPGISGTPSRNYVLEFTSTSGDEYSGVTKVTYCDGMGRDVESVTSGVAADGSDIVEAADYDAWGRKCRIWRAAPLTNAATSGFVQMSAAKTAIASYHGDQYPFASAAFGASSAGNIVSEERPGEMSRNAGARQTYTYAANNAGSGPLSCRKYTAVSAGECDVRIADAGVCPSGAYRIRHTVDYDGAETYEFTDSQGQVYLLRRICGKKTADTYYLRDGTGSLIAVLPPQVSEAGLSEESVDCHAYLYSYDGRHRLSAAKRPGCAWTRKRHDAAGRLIMEQDGNMRDEGLCRFRLYDRHGRECVTGTCRNSMDDTAWQEGAVYCYYEGKGGEIAGYSVSGITLDSPAVIKANYYDSYGFIGMLGAELGFRKDGASAQFKDCPTTLLTGCLKAVLGCEDGRTLVSACFYDDRCMPLQTVSTNIAGGVDTESMAYTEGGLLAWRTLRHETARGKDALERYSYTYDNAGRETSATYCLEYGGQSLSMPLSTKEYDGLGRLSKDTRTTSAGTRLAKEYGYDINDAIKETVHPLYSQRMYREDGAPMRSVRQYGGRLSATTWSAADCPGLERGYSYEYDSMGRLAEANYYEDGGHEEKYGTSYEYGVGGNATGIYREGLVGNAEYDILDDLFMDYEGGRLKRVVDLGTDSNLNGAFQFRADNQQTEPFSYDCNGNMTKNLYNGIVSIEYNIIGLPQKVTFTTGEDISFWYDADGNKVRSLYRVDVSPVMPPAGGIGDTGTEPSPVPKTQSAEEPSAEPLAGGRLQTYMSWAGNLEYGLGGLSRVYFDGGYVSVSVDGKTLADHHYVTDWQGNVRVVAAADGKPEQVNHYYPYGGLFGESTAPNGQRRRFAGKELERTRGLDWYCFGARWYDPAIARWTARDALEEKYPWMAAYGFCNDDPVNNVDPDGNDWYKALDGTYQFSPKVHSQNDLAGNRKYIGSSFKLGTRGNMAYYRPDGSILFDNETAAYKRMWSQADVHYRYLDPLGREVGAFLLTSGKVLVLPDYANEYDTSYIGPYGYKMNGTNIVRNGNERFNVLAQIHTHQKGTGKFEVSDGDVTVSESLGARPVFVMHWDNNLYVIAQNSWHSMKFSMRNKLNSLLKGRFKLFNYVTNRSWKFH